MKKSSLNPIASSNGKHEKLDYISLEEKFGAKNYDPIPVVLKKGRGIFVWDVDGKRYMDWLSAYSAVNQVIGILLHVCDFIYR